MVAIFAKAVAAHAIFEDRLYSDERFAFACGPAISRSIAVSRGATSGDRPARINRQFYRFYSGGGNRLIAALPTNSRRKADCTGGDAIISDESD